MRPETSTPISRRAAMAGIASAMPILAGCRSTPPFLDAAGRPVPGSIAEFLSPEINGVRNSVWLRGRDASNPLLVLLHGGPGASESALLRAFNAALEEDFVVAYWEQRGTGRSWHAGLDARSLTIAQLLQDLDQLVDGLRARLGCDKVTLLGHSWGTVLGVLFAGRNPAKVERYVGVAQVVHPVRAQELEIEFVAQQARERGAGRALAELARIGKPPLDVDAALALERWTERFGGLFGPGMSKRDLIAAALRTDEVNLVDLALFGLGNRFSLRALWSEIMALDLEQSHRSLEVPVVLVLGRHDRHVAAPLAARWLERLQAPAKELVWFERSAHNPPFEEPARFNELMRSMARRAARCRV